MTQIRRLAALLVFSTLPLTAHALEAREIMEKSEEARRTKELQADAVLKVTKAAGSTKEKSFTFWRKVKGDGVRFNSLTRFHSPREVKDEAILFLENAEGANDIFLYLPTYRKTRRVERSQQSGSFMGSDLSYSDLTTQHTEDYDYRLVKDGPCPTEEAKALKCHEIHVKPKTETVRERTGYAEGTTWIRQDNFMPVKAIYSDAQGKPVKEIESSKIEIVDPKEKKWFAHDVRVKNLKTGGTTSLVFSDVKANAGIRDSLFTQQALSSGAR